MASSKTIPSFYRIFFLYVDPLIAGSGVCMNIFTPQVSVDAFVPASISPYNTLQSTPLCHQIAGGLLTCAVLDFTLLRRTNEVWIWQAQQYAQLAYDVVILWSIWTSLAQQDRLHLAGLRIEDWGTIVIVFVCGLLRALFCANVGLRSAARAKKRS
ncbi:uncharacterized protein MYCFIDRAFT_211588 [Pseudocercospora fijiensis CIRAD86]|uniref:DUF7704 domain-containing protein n=1 Tax=Pseudocercospora fijiensis (strain CIRAD86) TaxID=383855 RepID=M3ACM3_PSEFD|nr:uncharacterized protein MYCFIDRAFT_211588 [Pseudocercospora fijiensis CIRAD86]EME82291.1 hypothetical protein MYCFIDRAFT_211588 [Pseudocercospora fijiensis CIRAD86]